MEESGGVRKEALRPASVGESANEPPTRKAASLAAILQIEATAKAENESTCLQKTCTAQVKGWSLFIAIMAVVCAVWLLCGTLFYRIYLGWNMELAFYYAVQAGFAVGYGVLVETKTGTDGATLQEDEAKNDVSRVFTVVYVCTGTVLFAVMLAFYADLMFTIRTSMEQVAEKHRLGVGVTENVLRGDQIEAEKLRVGGRWKRCFMWFRHNFIGQGKRVALIGALLFVIAVGIIWGIAAEEWTFAQSLYFSITTLTTSGLQSPRRETGGSLLFTAFFCLLGIPIYGAFVGLLSAGMTSFVQATRLKLSLNALLTAKDFRIAQNLAQGMYQAGDDEIGIELSKSDFMRLELLRCNLVTLSTFEHLDKKFEELDDDQSGFIDTEEILSYLLFTALDADQGGSLDEKEWRVACEKLTRWKVFPPDLTFDRVNSLFDDCDDDGDGVIDLREFRHMVKVVHGERANRLEAQLRGALSSNVGSSDARDAGDVVEVTRATTETLEKELRQRRRRTGESSPLSSPPPERATNASPDPIGGKMASPSDVARQRRISERAKSKLVRIEVVAAAATASGGAGVEIAADDDNPSSWREMNGATARQRRISRRRNSKLEKKAAVAAAASVAATAAAATLPPPRRSSEIERKEVASLPLPLRRASEIERKDVAAIGLQLPPPADGNGERRTTPDGSVYTKVEFIEFCEGGLDEWNAAIDTSTTNGGGGAAQAMSSLAFAMAPSPLGKKKNSLRSTSLGRKSKLLRPMSEIYGDAHLEVGVEMAAVDPVMPLLGSPEEPPARVHVAQQNWRRVRKHFRKTEPEMLGVVQNVQKAQKAHDYISRGLSFTSPPAEARV